MKKLSAKAIQVRDWINANPGQHTYSAVGEACGLAARNVSSVVRSLVAHGEPDLSGSLIVKFPNKRKKQDA